MRVNAPMFWEGGVHVGVFWPHRAEDKDWTPLRVNEETMDSRGNTFAYPAAGTEIMLSLVKPNHGAMPDTLDVGEGSLGACRVEGVP